jgi:hypothetical protein
MEEQSGMADKKPAKKKPVKKYKPIKDTQVLRSYLVEVPTHAHRPDQLDRLDTAFAREIYLQFGSATVVHVEEDDGAYRLLDGSDEPR